MIQTYTKNMSPRQKYSLNNVIYSTVLKFFENPGLTHHSHPLTSIFYDLFLPTVLNHPCHYYSFIFSGVSLFLVSNITLLTILSMFIHTKWSILAIFISNTKFGDLYLWLFTGLFLFSTLSFLQLLRISLGILSFLQ